MPEGILVTGGTGTTGRRVVRLLQEKGLNVRIGTRTPKAAPDVHFDWTKLETATAFDGCRAAYLVAPNDRTDHLAIMQPMLEQAMKSGTRRFVLLSSSLLEPGGPMMGEVHQWLAQNAEEWSVLRPSWFMQNFSEGPHRDTIRREGVIYSATGEGRVGFIDAEDIAASAVAVLMAEEAPNRDAVLTGPETLSYGDIAAVISEISGQLVRHVSLDNDALAERFRGQGLPPSYAQTLVALDAAIRSGAEDQATDAVVRITGREPTSFRCFAKAAARQWRRG